MEELNKSEEPVSMGQVPNLPPKITKDNINPLPKGKKAIILSWVRSLSLTVVAALLVAFAAHCLIAPNEFTIGGASGIAILVSVATNGRIQQSIILLCINLPMVCLAFIFVKRRFAILSITSIGLQSFFLFLFEKVLPDFTLDFGEGGQKIFAAIAAGLCIGTAVALALKAGGSTGGADILAVLIQKKFAAASIAWMLFAINSVVIVSSLFVFKNTESLAMRLLPIMMSVFEAYIESKTNESVTNGFQSAREFRIITDKPDEISQALMFELSRGVTALPATGMYTKEPRTMLLCVVNRRQVATLRKITKAIDPDSFVVMTNVSQVLGLGFYTNDI